MPLPRTPGTAFASRSSRARARHTRDYMGPSARTPPGAGACTQIRDSDHGGCDDQQVDIDSRMPTHAACLDRECAPRHGDHAEAASTACVTAHTLATTGAHSTNNKRGGDDGHAVLDVGSPKTRRTVMASRAAAMISFVFIDAVSYAPSIHPRRASGARDDPGEEYVARTVLRLWRRHGEDRRETRAGRWRRGPGTHRVDR